MSAAIYVNDPRDDNTVPLKGLQLGDFFRFPAGTEGNVYVVIEILTSQGGRSGVDAFTRYRALTTGAVYSKPNTIGTRVERLRLKQAEFDLMRSSR